MTTEWLIGAMKRSMGKWILVTLFALAIPPASLASDRGHVLLSVITNGNLDDVVKAFDDLTAAGIPVAKLLLARRTGDRRARKELRDKHGIEYYEQDWINRRVATRFYKGVEGNDAETITKLAPLGLDLNTQGPWERERTPLHYSAANGYVEATTALLNAGADPDKGDRRGYTPLQLAMTDIDSGVARTLLDAGADPNKGIGYLPLHIAVEMKSVELVQRLLDADADPNIVRPDRLGYSMDKRANPLFLAVLNGSNEILNALLAAGADPNLPSTDHGPRTTKDRTPLPEAASRENLAAVQALLAAGADPNILVARGTITPLSAAATSGNVDIISALLEGGAHLQQRNAKGETALHSASTDDVVAALVKAGIAVDVQDNEKNTPLALAAGRGDGKCRERPPRTRGQRPRIRRGMELDHTSLSRGTCRSSPSHHDADRGRGQAEQPKKEGRPGDHTPLHLAAIAHPKRRVHAVKALLDGGADPNIRVGFGMTPLHYAALEGSVETVKVLIEGGADPNATMIGGNTVLHAAAETREKGQIAVIKALIERGADPKRQNDQGFTPRHIAAQQRNHEAEKILKSYE